MVGIAYVSSKDAQEYRKYRDMKSQQRLGAFADASKKVYSNILALESEGNGHASELKRYFELQLKWFSAIYKNETGWNANVLEKIKNELEEENKL